MHRIGVEVGVKCEYRTHCGIQWPRNSYLLHFSGVNFIHWPSRLDKIANIERHNILYVYISLYMAMRILDVICRHAMTV